MTDPDDDFADDFVGKITLVMKAKAKLIKLRKTSGVARCSCSPKGTHTLRVVIVPGNNHARAFCSACKFSMME